MPLKVGILTTHPIQYQVPWFRALDKEPGLDLTVFYCMLPDDKQLGEGFGLPFQWDIPLLEGYKYRVLRNVASAPSISRFFGCDTPGISNLVRRGDFITFIVNGWVVKSCVQLLRACRKYKVPCIVRGDSNGLQPRPKWKRVAHRHLLSRYAAFLNVGKANKSFYLNHGVREEEIFFAPHCVDNERFETVQTELSHQREKIRSGWEIQSSAYTFLFCAKFIEKKRPWDLLRALDVVCKKIGSPGVKIHVLMVGDGELKSESERFAGNNALPVTFTGFLNQSEIARAYVASDCLVLPSDYGETWGLVVNEAMACGLPAIVSDRVGCGPDLVEEGVTGTVFLFGDVDALAEALISFAQNPEKAKAMGERAKELIRKYSIDEVVKGTMDAIRYVCKGTVKDNKA